MSEEMTINLKTRVVNENKGMPQGKSKDRQIKKKR